MGGFLPTAIPSVAAETPAWRGKEQGIPEEPETAYTETRWLDLCWLKLVPLGILNNFHMDQLHFQLGCVGLVSLLVVQGGPFTGLGDPCERWALARDSISFKYSLFK